ncbi:ATP-binding protein [Sediminibacterium sp.]|uniref:sensor histidine kinase n=1 Tax=Sediminibacterium sp. TaxID=1917865 RepID=UPI0025E60050|nr:ATP-binding protein [Sediminibacterium sp.]MBT9484159.1 PAS domain S-box protein [Sediminibacterium sp.]
MNLKKEELSFIFNSLPNAVLFESSDHTVQYVNQTFCTIFGIDAPADILIGTNCKDNAVQSAHYFSEPSLFLSRIESIYANGQEVLNEEIRFVSGQTLLRDYKPMTIDGNIIGHLWLYKKPDTDINFLSAASSERHFYEDLLDNIPADIAIFDPSHRYLFVNKLAISKKEIRDWIIGKDDFDYCKFANKPVDAAVSRRSLFEKALRSKKTVEFEEVNLDSVGNKVYNLRRFQPVLGVSENVEYVIGYGINISSIRESEQRLQQHYDELGLMFNNIDQLVVTLDMTGTVNFVNSQWLTLTGLEKEMLGENSIFRLIESGLEQFRKTLFTVFSGHTVPIRKENQVIITDKLGRLRTLRYYMSRFNQVEERGQIVAIFFTDITDQLRAEQDLLDAAIKERSLSDMKTNFMSMVSHELRTPLSVILSSAEILEMIYSKLPSKEIEKGAAYINRIIGQVDKMTQLMNDFLFISKIESGKIIPQLELIDVNSLLNEIKEESYSPWSDGRFLKMIFKGNPSLVKFDKTMIRHILINLLNNAFKYSANSKESPIVRVSYTRSWWFLTVVDCGIGIEEEDIIKLGEPFIRGSNVGEIEGTGLGLMTIKFFTDHHRGSFRVRSKKNKGTIVTIRFPYDMNKTGK